MSVGTLFRHCALVFVCLCQKTRSCNLMIKRKSLGWGKHKNLRGLGNYFPVEKSILKYIRCLFICKTLAGIQHHLHTGTGSYSFIASCSTDRLCDLGQMTSQFHVLCPCPPFNSSVGLDYELSATRTVVLYSNRMRRQIRVMRTRVLQKNCPFPRLFPKRM